LCSLTNESIEPSPEETDESVEVDVTSVVQFD